MSSASITVENYFDKNGWKILDAEDTKNFKENLNKADIIWKFDIDEKLLKKN